MNAGLRLQKDCNEDKMSAISSKYIINFMQICVIYEF